VMASSRSSLLVPRALPDDGQFTICGIKRAGFNSKCQSAHPRRGVSMISWGCMSRKKMDRFA
jgi:hypothetical protein